MKKKSWLWSFLMMGVLFLFVDRVHAVTPIDTEILAGKIASSLRQITNTQYNTLAISRIKTYNSKLVLNIDELIDYTNVQLVRLRRFKVTDRSKLQLILKEQRIQLSEFVSKDEYKELGRIMGVEVFVYGTIYRNNLLLKAIDVQTSAVIWADAFPLVEKDPEHLLMTDLAEKTVQSLQKDLTRFDEEKIKRISFWSIDTSRLFKSEEVLDYLTVAFAKFRGLEVIDRENLQLLYQEQKLNQEVFIDESKARRLGELYGVDAFLYGTINSRPEESYVGSFKIMSILTGVILWADLIKFAPPAQEAKALNPFDLKTQKRLRQAHGVEGMIPIPAGTFVLGSNDPLYNSSPERAVFLKGFMLDSHEVTNEEYAEFVGKMNHRHPTSWKGGTFEPNSRNHPVVGISWEDAKLYCDFVKKRLPAEAEWERAIRGPNGRKFPWSGESFSPSFAVTRESQAKHSVSVYVQNQDVTPEKNFHLAGNVREFVFDLYHPYAGNPEETNLRERVVRGSSWAFGAYEAVGFFRGHTRPNLAWPDVGFRCAKDMPVEQEQ